MKASGSVPDLMGLIAAQAKEVLTNLGLSILDYHFAAPNDHASTEAALALDEWVVSGPAVKEVVGDPYTGPVLNIPISPSVPCAADPSIPAGDTVCGAGGSSDQNAASDPNQHITYTVTGSARGDITYSPDGTSNSEQASSAHDAD